MNRTMKQAAGLAAGFMTQMQHQQTQTPGGNFSLPSGLYTVVAQGGLNVRATPAGQFITRIENGQLFGVDNYQPPVFVSGYWWVHGKYGQHLSGWVAARYLVLLAPDAPVRLPVLTLEQRAQANRIVAPNPSFAPPLLPRGDGPYYPRVGKMGVHGLPEDNMQSDLVSMAAGLGALFTGLAVPGPYGANPAQMMPSDTYEISGTSVEFRDAPSLGGAIIDTFNPDTSAGNSVVGTPDQVVFKGEIGTGNGLTWAKVTAKGKTGFVAVEYMAPVGWTAQQGKVVPKGGGGGGGGNIDPVSQKTPGDETTKTDYTPYILGGAAVLGGGIILWAVMAKPKKGGGKHRHRRHAHA